MEQTAADLTTDRDLLSQFASGDQNAFAELVARHGGMVLSVCRRVLGNERDAEDAFQQTFLTLAERAAGTDWQATIAGWLHETARRSAMKLRAKSCRRRDAEESLPVEPSSPIATPAENTALAELAEILDEELEQLPERFREAILLSQLAGLDRADIAKRLGVTVGAVKDRLERGRELLRERLVARGVTLSAVFVSAWLATSSASAAVSTELLTSTVSAASATAGVGGLFLTPSITSLLEGIGNMTLIDKLKVGALGLVSLLTAGVLVYAAIQDNPDRFEKGLRGKIVAIKTDGGKPNVTLDVDDHPVKLNLDIATDAKVSLAYESAQLADLKPDMFVAVQMADDLRTIKEIHARGLVKQVVVRSTDSKTLVAVVADDEAEEGDAAPPDVKYELAAGAVIKIGGLPAKLGEISPGLAVPLELAKDGKTINAIEVPAGSGLVHEGPVLEVDAVNRVIKSTVEIEDAEIEQHLDVASDAIVMVDGKLVPLAELKPGMRVTFRLSEDKKLIQVLKAHTPERDDED